MKMNLTIGLLGSFRAFLPCPLRLFRLARFPLAPALPESVRDKLPSGPRNHRGSGEGARGRRFARFLLAPNPRFLTSYLQGRKPRPGVSGFGRSLRHRLCLPKSRNITTCVGRQFRALCYPLRAIFKRIPTEAFNFITNCENRGSGISALSFRPFSRESGSHLIPTSGPADPRTRRLSVNL